MAHTEDNLLQVEVRANELLGRVLGPDARFRPGQLDAIRAVVCHRKRVLVVQRTGWGKSLIYFMATKLLRDRGAGPTLLVSPLLSLMRNQIAMAARIGIRAETVNSENTSEWENVERRLAAGEVDILLISPERLNNDRFLGAVLPSIRGRIGLFVVDEAHCISDWGHDFRPDYQRIVRVLRALPPNVPVLATTATANDRVVSDVVSQVGDGLLVLRGPLARTSLRLQNIRLQDQSERLAWLAEQLPGLPGSGIVYCLTVADSQRVAAWLRQQGIKAEAYYGDLQSEDRVLLEDDLLANRLKALVATVALGMGFDKPDLGFVVHYQRPGSVVAYYQQVGRAGRALGDAHGVLLSGREDDEIQDYFIRTAFPEPAVMSGIVSLLESRAGLGVRAIQEYLNVSHGDLERALKLLELAGAVGREGSRYFRTPNPWHPDVARAERVTAQRRFELGQMRDYVAYQGCLMEFLARALDDPTASACGRCANCTGKGLPDSVTRAVVAQAVSFLKGAQLDIQPRKQWPVGAFPDRKGNIPEAERAQPGRALSIYGDAGWGHIVARDKYASGRFGDDLVDAAVHAIEEWAPSPFPMWVTAIPSLRRPRLVPEFAERLAHRLHLPFVMVLSKVADTPEQKTMLNSAYQARNVARGLAVRARLPSGPVLLVDDVVDSGWTMTYSAALLRRHGSGAVFPFALASATVRDK